MVSKLESSLNGVSSPDECVLLPLLAEIFKQLILITVETIRILFP